MRWILPGLATHFIVKNGTRCGTYAPAMRKTSDRKAVDCIRCRRLLRKDAAKS